MTQISPKLAEHLLREIEEDKAKTREELIAELTRLRAAYNKNRNQSQNRGARVRELEAELGETKQLCRRLLEELRRYRAAATERGSVTPIAPLFSDVPTS